MKGNGGCPPTWQCLFAPRSPQTTLCAAGVTAWCFSLYFFLEEQVIWALFCPCYIVSVILSKHKTSMYYKRRRVFAMFMAVLLWHLNSRTVHAVAWMSHVTAISPWVCFLGQGFCVNIVSVMKALDSRHFVTLLRDINGWGCRFPFACRRDEVISRFQMACPKTQATIVNIGPPKTWTT